ncbi:hypothetical protein DYB28_006457 [Aphanomyces astaci]|uniref:Uncharacterized protein n=2 Tax=Aphanomyces astaci TaxID=112090 RepID=A0A397F0D7_APHAT|nr:hypothetical protein DYB31_004226 [Aphanomyces astaci]RHZ31945.1 hypothetical protein DYB26_014659 [Aphanomyces astaci]RLO09110.1 hypothetical protein DYB28_006457 [Aphanomyces astaci]
MHRLRSSLQSCLRAQLCPNLEELTVRNAEDGFLEQLLDAYTTSTTHPYRLMRLSLMAGHADVGYDAVVAALSSPDHPVSRVLRSLYIDVRGWDDEDVESLSTRLQHLLMTNSHLRDLTLCASPTWPPDDDVDPLHACGWTVLLLPLRQRLAALSVLRRINLPIALMASILSMAERHVKRFRMERKYNDD